MTAQKRMAVALATAAVTGGLLAAAPSAHASVSTVHHRVATASGVSSTYLQFVKNSRNPSNSTLRLVGFNTSRPDHPYSYVVASWRAGSGSGSTDSCRRNAGWLPDGTYTIQTFDPHHNGGAHGVNGLSWLLSDHKCHNGNKRTELFIHSEMLPSGKQGRSEPYRWDGNSDYKSNGCIKLKPSDARQLAAYRNTYPKPTRLYVS
ncbi:L,D-transpeptidase family protein [Streptomyces longwoodensis]|uniref:L,D-transpeptidase family protein n=1 Tax=Streptomyces longwoodensis TaxID=68231 RepID=UPI0033F0E973